MRTNPTPPAPDWPGKPYDEGQTWCEDVERHAHVTLPYPPTMNRMWRRTRTGRTYLSQEARHYKAAAALIALCAGMRPVKGEVDVHAILYRPRKAGDTDNFLKVVIDALKGIAFKDDSQVRDIHIQRREDKANPRIEVAISLVGGKGGA